MYILFNEALRKLNNTQTIKTLGDRKLFTITKENNSITIQNSGKTKMTINGEMWNAVQTRIAELGNTAFDTGTSYQYQEWSNTPGTVIAPYIAATTKYLSNV